MEGYDIRQNPELNIWEALLPVIVLIGLLGFNLVMYDSDPLGGTNQFILLLGGAVAAIIGFRNKVTYEHMVDEVGNNLKATAGAIFILLFVGALASAWMVSGIIPAMIYYGLMILEPSIFLPATVVITAIISLATGSSWATTATVGIALIGIGKALGIPVGMVAGAVISGAYFGDKMSPLSDTTNLAPAMAGGELFSHIRYMAMTTIPSITITIIVFIFLGFTQTSTGEANIDAILGVINTSFNIPDRDRKFISNQ